MDLSPFTVIRYKVALQRFGFLLTHQRQSNQFQSTTDGRYKWFLIKALFLYPIVDGGAEPAWMRCRFPFFPGPFADFLWHRFIGLLRFCFYYFCLVHLLQASRACCADMLNVFYFFKRNTYANVRMSEIVLFPHSVVVGSFFFLDRDSFFISCLYFYYSPFFLFYYYLQRTS